MSNNKRIKKAIITANKGNIGHLVAGAALTESVIAIQSLLRGQVPPICNLSADWSCRIGGPSGKGEPIYNGLSYAYEAIRKEDINVIVKNSLCFGGINMSAVFKRYQQR